MVSEYKTDQIRNVALVGHGLTGKSTLMDSMLFVGGKIAKIGTAETGTLVSDYDDEEKARKLSIRSSLGFVEIDGVKINIMDTPGTADFVGESRAAVQVAEAVILVVDSVDGVQIETEKWWRYLTEKKIPSYIFVNKMDKERANFADVLEQIKGALGGSVAALTIPNGEGEQLKGVVDIVDMKLMTPKGEGKEVTLADVPADLKGKAESGKSTLMELAAEGEDALIEKFLEGEELTLEEIRRGLKAQLAAAKLTPVICGSSAKGIGVKNLLKAIVDFAPSPAIITEYKGHEFHHTEKEIEVKAKAGEPFSGIVWKTYIDQFAGRFSYIKVTSGELLHDMDVIDATKNTKERIGKIYTMIGSKQEELPKLACGDIGVVVKLDSVATLDTLCDPKRPVVIPAIKVPEPVFSFAVVPNNKADSDKIGQFLTRVTIENPTIKYAFNAETHESVLSGMGEIQLDIVLKTLRDKNKIEVSTREPRVAYRETITKKAESQYKHKKQTGGHGQYGEVFLRLYPLARGTGFEFQDSIVGGVVPKSYIPGVEKGVREALLEGVLAKFPVVDVKAELFFGSYHDVDSSEMAFKIASRTAFKNGMEQAGPQLLEPVMEVSIYVDKEFMGDILSDITSRRGKVLGMDSSESANISIVRANVPLAEMQRYSIDLRAMTSGKATFEMKFSHYDPIGGREAEKVIESRKKQLEEEAAAK